MGWLSTTAVWPLVVGLNADPDSSGFGGARQVAATGGGGGGGTGAACVTLTIARRLASRLAPNSFVSPCANVLTDPVKGVAPAEVRALPTASALSHERFRLKSGAPSQLA